MFFLLVIIVGRLLVSVSCHPYEDLSIVEMIKLHHYPVEVHSFYTPDGYILQLQRIPHSSSNNASKEVALLVHGTGGGSENFVTLGPPDALAFYLSDRGYDVWLFNARGTSHSRAHRRLNPFFDRKKFWNFSWHEIGIFDLPSTIDYILKSTGKKKLFYVGHSQGTTVIFVMLSEMPHMNNKIKVAGMLAPSAYVNYTQSPIVQLSSRIYPLAQRILDLLTWYELMIPNSPILNDILKLLCSVDSLKDTCLDLIYFVGGTESGYIDKELLPTILHFSPTGFAARQIFHYAQIIVSGEFKQFDFGDLENLKRYDSTKPPLYYMSNVGVPVGLFWAPQDPFANAKMIAKFKETLPNIALVHEVKAYAFNHLDYLFANNVVDEVYEPLYKLFRHYED